MNNHYKIRETLYNKTLTKAQRQLSKEYVRCYKETKSKLLELLVEIEASKQDGSLLVSDLYKFNRYYDLANNLSSNLKQMGEKELTINSTALTKMYKENSKIIGKEVGFKPIVNDAVTVRAINTAWCKDNKVWSDRVWTNKAMLQNRLLENLVNQVATGQSKDKIVAQLQRDFDVAFYEADRIARTELSYVQTKSTLDVYKQAGVEYYEILSDQAEDECADSNGEKIRIDEAEVGENLPPFHPNCRCTILAVIPED